MAEDEVVKAISTLMEALTPLDPEAREHALDFVMKRLAINLSGPARGSFATPAAMPEHVPTPHPSAPTAGMDIRTFAGLKEPATLNETVAVMAFFLAQVAPPEERRDFITSDDIKPYFIQADFELPTGPTNMTLTNAKNAGYLNALERGQYRLNSVGHNLVAHKLPKKAGDAPRKSTRTTRKAKKSKR